MMTKPSDLLLVTPPLTQLNCPYPASMVLTGFLRSRGFDVHQLDLSISLIDKVFTREFISEIFDLLEQKRLSKPAAKMVSRRFDYEANVEIIIKFLRSPDENKAKQILENTSLPRGPRFKQLKNLEFATSSINDIDLAITIATFFIQDITDLIRENIDQNFDLIKYGEKISAAIADFQLFEATALSKSQSKIDDLMVEILDEKLKIAQPKIVGFTVPFPGNFYGALICARHLRKYFPHIKIVMGGGFVSTELRQMSQANLFKYVDYLVFDDGELPLERILKFEAGEVEISNLVRTWVFAEGEIQKLNFDSTENIPFSARAFADYSDVETGKYLSLIETPNPMLNLWSRGFWNKITLAHGCYWAQCAFCDTTLDYIKRYEPGKAGYLVDQMEFMMKTTGSNGFHFTDEAAPPALLRKVSEEILKRGLKLRWWGNIRFERTFSDELCQLMADAGCIAVSGGLETVSPRLLKLINKGVDVESATRTLESFAKSGIMVHAYLMYGFPSQTTAETIEALQIVRDWFKAGLLHSGFWHRYAMTIHSPSSKLTSEYGVELLTMQANPFANNEIYFDDPTPADHYKLEVGLNKALYNFMLGNGLDFRVEEWWEE